MIHLRQITYQKPASGADQFPFSVPLIQNLQHIHFEQPVTFLVGENGSGKSTLLEAIACAVESITVGAESVTTDPTLANIRQLASHFRLSWQKRTRRGFFMRSEDFFSFAKRIARMRHDMQQEIQRVDEEYKGRSDFAKDLAKSSFARELAQLKAAYGEGLDVQSHGESYLKLFNARFVPDGLYLLDEPEMPLSPMRQMTLISMLHWMTHQQNAQFIIATHSPILLAYPHATILSCDGGQVTTVAFDELEHVSITRQFLSNPDSFLRHLLQLD